MYTAKKVHNLAYWKVKSTKPKHPRCIKRIPKRTCWKRREIKPRLSALTGLKIQIIMSSLKKHCCFGCSRHSDVDGIKSFDKDDRPKNIKMKEQCFVAWSLQHQETLSTQNNIQEALTTHFDFISLSTRSF